MSGHTTYRKAAVHGKCARIFEGLLKEVRELTKKKPETTLNELQVKIINRVLDDTKEVFDGSDQAPYLGRLDEKNRPRNCDAVLVMVQYEAALSDFVSKYYQNDMNPLGWAVVED